MKFRQMSFFYCPHVRAVLSLLRKSTESSEAQLSNQAPQLYQSTIRGFKTIFHSVFLLSIYSLL